MAVESENNQKKKLSPTHSEVRKDALISASGNLAAWFLKDNKDKGRPLMIPKLGITLNADGTVDEIKPSK